MTKGKLEVKEMRFYRIMLINTKDGASVYMEVLKEIGTKPSPSLRTRKTTLCHITNYDGTYSREAVQTKTLSNGTSCF